MASGRPIFITILMLLHLAWTNGQTQLEILPNGDKHSKPSGDQLLLTCRLPTSGDPNLVNIEWLGPNMSRIESRHFYTSSNLANVNLYTEKHQDSSSLSLVFSPLKEELSGRYTCTGAYANAEKINKSVDIETIETITFKDAPEYQYATLGKEYKIKCEVKARPAPTVDWLKNGDRLVTGDHYIIETHALKINNVTDDDKGVYNCRAAVIQTGELQERFITLEVQEEPKMNEVQKEIEIIEGKSQKIDVCRATGKPAPKYSWIQTMERLNLSNADRFIVDRDTGLLQITDVKEKDGGEYKCEAKNAAGSATIYVIVKVLVKPKIMEFLNKTIAVGKEIQIECKARGIPAPDVTFKKQTSSKPFVEGTQPNDDRISLRTFPDYVSGKTTSVLTITNVLRQDDGIYECIASNKVEETRKNGHLTVEFPPSFELMSNQTIWSWDRRPVNLTCIAESIPNATIQWFHGDRPLFQANNYDDRNIYKQFGKGPVSTLNVIPSDQRFYGYYKCKANNVHGENSHTIELKLGEVPKIISQVRTGTITATTISFEIVPPPMHPELPVKTITVQYKTENEFWPSAKNKTWSLNSPYVLENLIPQASYEFRFHATNDVGSGGWTNTIRQTMPMRSVPQTPKLLMNKENAEYDLSSYSHQYQVKWMIPLDNGEPIDKYELRICEIKRVGGDWQLQDRTCRQEEIKGQRADHHAKNLIPDKYYSAELRAHNSIGYSEPGMLKFRTIKASSDGPVLHQGPLMSSAAIIGTVIAILLLIILIVDTICCCAHKTGIIFYLCERSKRKPVDEEDAKLGSLYGWRFPLPYCDQKMANVAGVTAIQDSSSGKNTIKLVKHTAIEEKEPLKEEKKITPIIDSGLRRETSITFDGKRSISKTGFVGKDSAV